LSPVSGNVEVIYNNWRQKITFEIGNSEMTRLCCLIKEKARFMNRFIKIIRIVTSLCGGRGGG
jgi:hypothetical protein